MYELPASVRLALWLTHAFRYRTPLEDAVREALPDVDAVDGSVERLEAWRELGEHAVCVDLPRPGVHGGLLPPTSAGMDAALDVGECLFVPSLGGCIVPRPEWYGPRGDQGLKLTMEAHDSDPVPIHRLEMLDLASIDRHFTESMLQRIGALENLDVQPFVGSGVRARVDGRLDEARWALPRGLNSRAVKIIMTTGTVVAALDHALEEQNSGGGVDARALGGRDAEIRALLGEAETAMAQAATVACLELGGLR